ncbi:MAG: porin [Rhodoferax sp.]|uniref:porin n=1 Tax=Rhodoferax sp. TaxID=50421 RepID=UPI00326331DC
MHSKLSPLAPCAMAALFLCASSVQAQPAQSEGVQIYGLVDNVVGRFAGTISGVNAQSQTASKLEGGGMSTSHWGLRGNESLGDGLTASFELSAFFRSDTGASGRSDAVPAPVNVAADPFFSRAAWVGLSSPRWGRVRMGNIISQLFLTSISSNAFGDSMTFGPLPLLTFTGGVLGGGTSWTNSVVYDTPTWGGASATVARSLSENQGGGNSAVRIGYGQGPLATSLVWQSVKKDPQTFADGTTTNDTTAWQLMASYDFDVVKVYGHVGHIQNKGTAAVPLDIGYRVWDLSAAVPVGAGRLLAGYGVRSTGDTVGPVPATLAGGNVERKILTLGYDHNLSKRTDIYAMLMRDSTRTHTLPAPFSVIDASGTSFGVGIRHRF